MLSNLIVLLLSHEKKLPTTPGRAQDGGGFNTRDAFGPAWYCIQGKIPFFCLVFAPTYFGLGNRGETMTTLRMWAAIACVLAVLLTGLRHTQARLGPRMPILKQGEVTTRSGDEVHQMDTTKFALGNRDFPGMQSKDAEDLQMDDELEIHCDSTEPEVCDQKRRLTANMDYAHDGPNDPITDPPH